MFDEKAVMVSSDASLGARRGRQAESTRVAVLAGDGAGIGHGTGRRIGPVRRRRPRRRHGIRDQPAQKLRCRRPRQ